MNEPGLAGAVWGTGSPDSDAGSGLASSARPGTARSSAEGRGDRRPGGIGRGRRGKKGRSSA
eukprot:4498123-Lingulodinium_polyedra.AAC.1